MLFFFHTTFHFKTALKAFILLPNVLNHRWLAECAEVASIVIELVIGNYHPLQTTITITSNSSCFEVKCAMEDNGVRQPERQLHSSLHNHTTLMTIRTSEEVHFNRNFHTLNASRWFPHRCSKACQCVVVGRLTGQPPLMLLYGISL